mgnify:CR=1 FL=1
MKIIPVSNVGQGIGESSSPIMDSRSAGMPLKSKSIAAMARTTTSRAMARTPIPEIVS